MLTSTYSPVRGIRFLANKCLNVYSVPASGGSLDEAVRGELHLTACVVVVCLAYVASWAPSHFCAFTAIARERSVARRLHLEPFWYYLLEVHKMATGI